MAAAVEIAVVKADAQANKTSEIKFRKKVSSTAWNFFSFYTFMNPHKVDKMYFGSSLKFNNLVKDNFVF